jgi:hypothetical protein
MMDYLVKTIMKIVFKSNSKANSPKITKDTLEVKPTCGRTIK